MMVVCLRYAKNEAQANDFLLGTFKLFFNNFVAPAAKVEDIEAWVKTQFINELVVLILANKQEYHYLSFSVIGISIFGLMLVVPIFFMQLWSAFKSSSNSRKSSQVEPGRLSEESQYTDTSSMLIFPSDE